MKNVLENCPDSLSPLLAVAVDAAVAAGDIVRNLYGKPHTIKMKGAIDLVTEADIASENTIISLIKERFPEHVVIGEESGGDAESCGDKPTWIVDPLDGTTNFAHGFPYFGVSIACRINNLYEIGVINCPMQKEMFVAWRNGGAYLNGVPVSVSGNETLVESLVATGFPYNIQERLDTVLTKFSRVLPAVRDIRRAGAAALDLAYVACGRLDGFWEIDLKPWDTAAGFLLVREAGGKVSDFTGSESWTPFASEVVATNGRIHTDLVSMLS